MAFDVSLEWHEDAAREFFGSREELEHAFERQGVHDRAIHRKGNARHLLERGRGVADADVGQLGEGRNLERTHAQEGRCDAHETFHWEYSEEARPNPTR